MPTSSAEPLGPHAGQAAAALLRATQAGPAAWTRADLPHTPRLAAIASRLDGLRTLLGRPTVDVSADVTYPVRRHRVATPVVIGVQAISYADTLTPDDFAHATRSLVALIGPVPWPATHPLCRVCPEGDPLGIHMEEDLRDVFGGCPCPAWPGMTVEETEVARTLVRDQQMPWTEIVAAVPRLV